MPHNTLNLQSNPGSNNADDRNFLKYQFAKGRFKKAIDDFSDVRREVELNRNLRYVEVDVEEERRTGDLKEDETYIPVRLIDTNITREQPQYISYITQSRREAVFVNLDNIIDSPEPLEKDFTRRCRYDGWEEPFIRTIDGFQTHGWDFVEVLFDIDKPGHFAIEHVGTDQLIFDKDTQNIQSQEYILRQVQMTAVELEDAVENFGFNKKQVDELKNGPQNATQKVETSEKDRDLQYDIYKVFFRQDGIIYVSWFCPDCTGYIKEPEPLYLGRNDISAGRVDNNDFPKLPETEYPFYIAPYVMKEDHKILKLEGRAALDEYPQDAASALQSAMVNGTLRATNVYASQANNTPSGNKVTKSNVSLRPGYIYDNALNFQTIPYPSDVVIKAFQTVITQNQNEQSQINFAALNREDSRKTAREISAAQSEAAKLGSVQVTLLSTFVKAVRVRCWNIFQNRVLQFKISVSPDLFKYFGQIVQNQQTGEIEEIIPLNYSLRPSGDVDVIQRQEKILKQKQDWPVISNTPLAMTFLKDILRTSYPEDADRYIAELDQSQQDKQLIATLGEVIKALAIDPETGNLVPQAQPFANQLQALGAAVRQSLGVTNEDNNNGQRNGTGPAGTSSPTLAQQLGDANAAQQIGAGDNTGSPTASPTGGQ